MTREKAIELIGSMKGDLSDFYDDNDLVALDMAISALSEELSEDGTLTVHVSDGSKVKRVFVMGDNIFGGLYYPDSAENKGEWIKDHEVNDVAENAWYTVYRCSECGCLVESWKQSNFCPNCGADMRGET